MFYSSTIPGFLCWLSGEESICQVQFSCSVVSDSLQSHGCQASLSITNSRSLLKLMSIESVCHSTISACQVGDVGLIPGSGRSPGEGHGNPRQVFLPGKSYELRSLAGCSPWGCRESDMTYRLKTNNTQQ